MSSTSIMLRLALVLVLAALYASPCLACRFGRGEAVVVEDAIDGETLHLRDGREVRLIGIRAPQPAIAKAPPEPFAEEARKALSQWTRGKSVTLHYAGPRRVDRYDRVLAHVTRDDGLWLQARLMEAGLARVSGTPETRRCLGELLVLEKVARDSRRGLWTSPYYAVRRADDLQMLLRLEGSYQLVEGTITRIASVDKRLYLNFGDDWRTDFTVTVQPAEARLFLKGEPSTPFLERVKVFRESWEGKDVRLRGWLGKYNGPEMRMTYPEQMELLADIHKTGRGDAAKSNVR